MAYIHPEFSLVGMKDGPHIPDLTHLLSAVCHSALQKPLHVGFPAHFLCHHQSPIQWLYIKLYFFFVNSFCLSVRNPHPKRSQDFTLTKRANTGAMGWAKGRPWNVRSKTPGRDLCLGEAQWTWRGTLQGDLRTVIRAQQTASPFQIQNRPGLSCWVQISRVILTSDCHDLKWVIWRLEMFWS